MGDLRFALEPVPADTPLMAHPAEDPGGKFENDLQLVIAAAVNNDLRYSKTGDYVPTLTIELSCPSGPYTDRDGKTVEHEAHAITAGAVLATLGGLRPEMPIQVWTAAPPGGSISDETIQMVYDAAMGAEWHHRIAVRPKAIGSPPTGSACNSSSDPASTAGGRTPTARKTTDARWIQHSIEWVLASGRPCAVSGGVDCCIGSCLPFRRGQEPLRPTNASCTSLRRLVHQCRNSSLARKRWSQLSSPRS